MEHAACCVMRIRQGFVMLTADVSFLTLWVFSTRVVDFIKLPEMKYAYDTIVLKLNIKFIYVYMYLCSSYSYHV